MVPSVRKSSSTRSMSKVTCCILPRMSVKRTSTYLTSFSLISARILLASHCSLSPDDVVDECGTVRWPSAPVSPVRMRTTSMMSETKILPSPILPVRAAVWIASMAARQLVVGDHHLDLDLGQEVHDVLGAAVELGVALLAAVALGLEHGHALDAEFLQRLLHLVELERLDDGFDLLHRGGSEGPGAGAAPVARLAARPSARSQGDGRRDARRWPVRERAPNSRRRRPNLSQRMQTPCARRAAATTIGPERALSRRDSDARRHAGLIGSGPIHLPRRSARLALAAGDDEERRRNGPPPTPAWRSRRWPGSTPVAVVAFAVDAGGGCARPVPAARPTRRRPWPTPSAPRPATRPTPTWAATPRNS